MKKPLLITVLFFLVLLISGCSKPVLSYYVNKGDTFENEGFKLSFNEINIDENIISFELQYMKYKSVLPDMSISNINFTYGETAYDYLQLSDYASDEIYFTSIDGVQENLSTYGFVANQTYSIVITIDFEYFLNDVLPSGEESSIDFDSIVIYLDVSTYHLRLRSQE